MNIYKLLTLFIFAISCYSNGQQSEETIAKNEIEEGRIFTGAERVYDYGHLLKGKRTAVVVNQTSKINNKHLVDSLISLNINVTKIFAPEHGFRGEADAGEHIKDGFDSKSGLPLISLYGKNKKPSEQQLQNVDVILFDIQDVGVRFYTYISTMHYVMEAASDLSIPVIVLDRPNPNIHYVDGPVLDMNFKSFVGMHPVPVVYGMTIGEYAQMIKGESWLDTEKEVDLTVIPCKNYDRNFKYTLPIKPSPNLPNSISILHYPSLCFFEGTSVSVGRGTEFPFQVFGHPKLIGYFNFTPITSKGAKYPKHENKICFGQDLRMRKPKQDELDLSFLLESYNIATENEIDFFNDNNFFNLLAGTDQLKEMILAQKTEKEIRDVWQDDLNIFKKMRSKYLIYE